MLNKLASFSVPIVILYLTLSVLVSSFGIKSLYTLLGLSADRYILAQETVHYLKFGKSISESSTYLRTLTDYSGNTLYTSAEISHLLDVKLRFDVFRSIGLFFTAFLFTFTILKIYYRAVRQIRTGLLFGFKVTMIIVVFVGIALLLFWKHFFILFHEIVFPKGNWSFPQSSALIQLFPEQFWFVFGVSLLSICLALSLFFYFMMRVLHFRALQVKKDEVNY
jgi:integral membrane protein (TIGR01906 family)